jgi:cation diffusion facilitator family transporter
MTVTIDRANNFRAIRRVLWIVLAANLAVTVLKIALGLYTGALSVVADGFHSLVDSSSNLIGLAAIRLAERPADKRHPYGYARYETIGSLAIGALLLVAAYEIGSAIIKRIGGGAPPDITPLTLILIAITFPINLMIVILETRAGKRLNSEILIADATHTRTDLFVTGSVIASMIGVWLGFDWLDPLVASLVVILILQAAFSILKNAAGWLADASIINPDEIEAVALDVPGVWYIHQTRSRGAPGSVFVDLHAKVYPGMSTEQAHSIATEIEKRVKERFAQVIDVLVHIEPGKIDPQQAQKFGANYQIYQQIAYDLRQIADGLGLGVHDLHVSQDANGKLEIEAHLEFKENLTLQEAHAAAEEFESRIRQKWPETDSIITHLEPLPQQIQQPTAEEDERLKQEIKDYLTAQFSPEQVLEIHTHPMNGHINVALRLGLPGETRLEDAHNLAEKVERELLSNIGDLQRITVHIEPYPPTIQPE